MLTDAHLHITKKDIENGILQVMEAADLYGLTAGTNPKDCAFVESLAKCQKRIIPTYGLHPWYADQYEIKDMAGYLQNCCIIGEIGMDSVWCETDLVCQREIFLAQMDIAQERGCPVILHTKGEELEIGKIIADYSMPIIVHWYSSQNHLDFYLQRGCYFTVGPDVLQNTAVQQVVKEVPLCNLLVESDGLSALEWALGESIAPEKLPQILKNTISTIAEMKKMDHDTVQKEIERNFQKFVTNK